MSLKNYEKDTEAKAEDSKPNKDHGEPEQRISAALTKPDLPPPPPNGHSSPKGRRRWLKRARVVLPFAAFMVELLGLLGLAIYALLTWGLYDSSQQTITEIERQMRIDERPWLAFVGYGETSKNQASPNKFLPNQPIIVLYGIKNYGKTAARDIKASIVVEVLRNGEEPNIPEAAQPTNISPAHPGQVVLFPIPAMDAKTGVINPGDTIQAMAIRAKVSSTGSGAVDLLSAEEVRELQKGQAFIAAWGEISYFDIFAVRHWTKFCAEFLRQAPDDKCRKYNDIDRNDGADQTAN